MSSATIPKTCAQSKSGSFAKLRPAESRNRGDYAKPVTLSLWRQEGEIYLAHVSPSLSIFSTLISSASSDLPQYCYRSTQN